MKTISPTAPQSCATLFALILAPLTLADTPHPEYAWNDVPEESYCELTLGDRPLVRYMYAPLDETSASTRDATYKPFLHVYSPDGSQLITKGPGGLFPHHRGIFFGFNKITYGPNNKKCDTWHCRGKAHQQHEKFSEMKADADGGVLESIVHWHGREGEHFATETRCQTVAMQDGVMQIDFRTTLTPTEEVGEINLDGDPQHAGVQFRASQKVPDETAKKTYYIRTDGKGEPGDYRNWNQNNAKDPMNGETTNRPWLAASFVIDDQRYTVLRLDHPSNPRPSHYSERDYARFGSFFTTDLSTEEPLKLNYRFIVKQGEMTVEECQDFSDAFVGDE